MSESFVEIVSVWTSVVGTALGIVGLVNSQAWLAILGIGLLVVTFALLVWARALEAKIRQATINIAQRNIDSINMANLTRRINRTLGILKVIHVAKIWPN